MNAPSKVGLVHQANELLTQVEQEIATKHKELTVLYGKKFPELNSIHLNPLDYIKTVQAIANETVLRSCLYSLASILYLRIFIFRICQKLI